MAYKIKRKVMKDKRIDETGYIHIEETPKKDYVIMYSDKNGHSILAKTKYKTTAVVFAKKFNKDLYAGKLLKPDKSIWRN